MFWNTAHSEGSNVQLVLNQILLDNSEQLENDGDDVPGVPVQIWTQDMIVFVLYS